ncbi:beta-1,3-galactosyltransferase 1-like [Saccostrea echinata]|uniref:beta-1,3-galactosyltransferase 1-like n=1 Tax=Saccostrea echinata TaxID=191078 RepID=UPI002A8210B0|nr:beta-1,3-galactosyltransferase 1-like [Saccostrea echinata]XP_061169260.1 beta-1,3-galactosyltransferase 1-like [Saccostrea echinata]
MFDTRRIKQLKSVLKWIILVFLITFIVCIPFRSSKNDIQLTSYKLVQAYVNSGIIRSFPSNPVICNEKDVFLLVMVPSAVSNFEQRNAIRSTWGNLTNVKPIVLVKFLLGKSKNTALQDVAATENQIYNDILFEDIIEAYENLTRKSIAMLRWASMHCHRVRYLLKVDDDIFLNLPRLLEELKKHPRENSIIGCKVKGSTPFRFPFTKWRVSRTQYKGNYYPDYIAGTAYLISGDILQKLYSATQQVPYFIFEDIYITGLCREYIGVRAEEHKGFSCGYRDKGPCGKNFRYGITGHHYSPSEIKRMWLDLQDRWSNCRIEDYYFIYKLVDLFRYIFL